jgi:type I restriction enzyme M protein
LVRQHRERIRKEIERRETEEVERLKAEYAIHANKLAKCDEAIAAGKTERDAQTTKAAKKPFEATIAKLEKQREKPAAKLGERDERIAEARRRGEDDRRDVATVGEELIALYNDPDELLKHARVVSRDEIEENEFNLNIPRYVDTFEPEPRIEVNDALAKLAKVEIEAETAQRQLRKLLGELGYAS